MQKISAFFGTFKFFAAISGIDNGLSMDIAAL